MEGNNIRKGNDSEISGDLVPHLFSDQVFIVTVLQ